MSENNSCHEQHDVTPLHWACIGHGRPDVVAFLLDSGANIHAKTKVLISNITAHGLRLCLICKGWLYSFAHGMPVGKD